MTYGGASRCPAHQTRWDAACVQADVRHSPCAKERRTWRDSGVLGSDVPPSIGALPCSPRLRKRCVPRRRQRVD
jgi:hypothetical protein